MRTRMYSYTRTRGEVPASRMYTLLSVHLHVCNSARRAYTRSSVCVHTRGQTCIIARYWGRVGACVVSIHRQEFSSWGPNIGDFRSVHPPTKGHWESPGRRWQRCPNQGEPDVCSGNNSSSVTRSSRSQTWIQVTGSNLYALVRFLPLALTRADNSSALRSQFLNGDNVNFGDVWERAFERIKYFFFFWTTLQFSDRFFLRRLREYSRVGHILIEQRITNKSVKFIRN